MAKYFIIGETGNDELWLVDVEKRTVAPLTDDALKMAGVDDPDLTVKNVQTRGVIEGIGTAIAVNSRSGVTTKSLSDDSDND